MLALLHTSKDGAVAVQVLQTFSIILDSVSDPKFLYALFSNNFVNDLIAAPIDTLYTTTVALFDHPDAMVRVAVRAITLNVFRINDPGALEFILHLPQCAHFWELIVCSIKDSYDDALRILVDMLPMRRSSGVVATSAVDRAQTETQGWNAIWGSWRMSTTSLAWASTASTSVSAFGTFPPRPTSMGGINTVTRTTRARTNSEIKPRHLA
ncbi:Protein CL16A [Coemansia sp. RSA 1972]|nr:Protein CL16A [Coemansia sp. RSA 1972]